MPAIPENFAKEDAFIEEHLAERVSDVALLLSRDKTLDSAYILRQIEGRQRLVGKVPSWTAVKGLLFPPRLSLEQCSGEFTARYKATVVRNTVPGCGAMADLTGGFGVDFSFLSPLFGKAYYVERQSVLCAAARHNFPLLGLKNAEIIEADGLEFLKDLKEPLDFIFLDPARRDEAGGKTVLIEDCTPNVAQEQNTILSKASLALVKLSPMLDLTRALHTLSHVREGHVVSENRECKELLLLLDAAHTGEPRIVCADENGVFSFLHSEEAAATPLYADAPETYLYEPNAAIMKSGAFKLAATRFALKKLHPNSHLYTSEQFVENFPGRAFRVLRQSGCGKRELKKLVAATPKANLTVRNFPETVANLRRRIGLREGGNEYWFATTNAKGEHLMICCERV